MNRAIEEIPSSALDELTMYDWPGNIRELQNLVERSVILSPGPVLQIAAPDSLPVSDSDTLRKDVGERERIIEALRLSGGKIGGGAGAAVRLGLKRTTLQSRIKKLNIERAYR